VAYAGAWDDRWWHAPYVIPALPEGQPSTKPAAEGAVQFLVRMFMGGSLNPQTEYPDFANNPHHEFNFWFDPEAAHIVLRASWKKIVCTPTDFSRRASPPSATSCGTNWPRPPGLTRP
jgi:purine nucleosidase